MSAERAQSKSDPHPQASKADIPHMMFYGCSGAGKKTRVMAFLRAVFGGGVEKVRESLRASVLSFWQQP